MNWGCAHTKMRRLGGPPTFGCRIGTPTPCPAFSRTGIGEGHRPTTRTSSPKRRSTVARQILYKGSFASEPVRMRRPPLLCLPSSLRGIVDGTAPDAVQYAHV